MKKYLLNFILTLVVAVNAQSQTYDFDNSKFSNFISLGTVLSTSGSDTFSVEHDKWSYMCSNSTTWGSNLKFKSLHNFVKFYVDYGNNTVVTGNYTYLITFTLKGYNNPAVPTAYTLFSDTLNVSYNRDSLKAFQDKFYKKYSGFHRMHITVMNTFKLDANNNLIPLNSTNADGFNCRIEGEIWAQYYDKNYYGGGMTPLLVTQDASAVNTKKELKVSWNCNGCSGLIKPAMYELEWLHIDDYGYTLSSATSYIRNANGLNYDFRNNATRIVTKNNWYKIPVVFDRGYLVYRVRMVRPDSIDYILPIYGQWSLSSASGVVSTVPNDHKYYNSSPFMSDSLNWQYALSFAEDGKNKHVVSYYDGLLHNKQSVTRVNSDSSNVIVTKSIEDFEGRPSIQILPVPVQQSNIEYVKDFAKHSATNYYYKASDFDSIKPGNSVCSPPIIDSLHTSSKAYTYYSPNNPFQSAFNKYIPNANGFPLIQSVLSPENPKKIFTQGGAGKELQIGTGHETKYGYSGLTQQEVNRLFGSEGGYNSYYQKTKVRDPNGQTSIQVNNSSGQVVYSSMIGIGPDSNIHPIIPMSLPGTTSYYCDLIGTTPQSIGWGTKTLNSSFDSDVSGNAPVNYTVSYSPFSTGCTNKYLSVQSTYHYEILDQCFQTVASASGTIGTNGVMPTNATLSYSAPSTASLNPETYTVNKVLTFNPMDIAASVDSFIQSPNNCLYDENYFIRKEIETRQFPCPPDTGSICDDIKKMMIEEMYPMHKYGMYIQTGGGLFAYGQGGSPAANPKSIFTNMNNCDCPPAYRYLDSCIGWQNTGYSNVPSLTQDQFIAAFNDEIAEILLPQHPEYCRLAACYLQEDRYSDTLSDIDNTIEADDLGYLFIDDIADKDPLFLKSLTVKDSLIHFVGKNNRIDSFAVMQSLCGGLTPQVIMTSISDIYDPQLASSNPYPFLQTEPVVYEFYYSLLQQIYISNREKIKAKILMNASDSCGPCAPVRIELIPPALFPTLNGATLQSYLDSLNQVLGNDTTYGNLSGLGIPDWMIDAFDSGTVTAATLDSVNANCAAGNALLCEGMIDAMMHKYKNCTLSGSTLASIRTQLYNIICVQGQELTFAHITTILNSVGIAQNDICNPFVLLDDAMSGFELKSDNLFCKSNSYYTDALAFLSQASVKNTFNTTSTATITYTLSVGNSFELTLLNHFGLSTSTPVNISNTYITSEQQYKMTITYGSNILDFWFNNVNNTSTAVALSQYSSWSFTDVLCLTDYSNTVLPTHVNLRTFAVKVTGSYGAGTLSQDFLGYNDGIKMIEISAASNKVSFDATACVELKRWYTAAKSQLDALGIKYTHQNYEKAIMNIINSNTNKIYTYDDIMEFVKSCALTDTTKQMVSIANYELLCADSAAADNVLISLYTFLGGYLPSYQRYCNSSNQNILLIRYNDMTDDSTYLALNSYISSVINFPTSVIISRRYLKTYGNDTLAIIYIPVNSTLNTSLTPSSFANVTDVSMVDISTGLFSGDNFYAGTGKIKMKAYAIKLNSSSLAPHVIARYADSLWNFAHHNGAGFRLHMNYAGMMNEDYYLTEKQQWLQYNYATSALRHDSVLNHISIANLTSNITSFNGKFVEYGHPVEVDKADAIYVNQPSTYSGTAGYNMLNAFFSCISAKLGSMSGYPITHAFVFEEDSIIIPYTTLSTFSSSIINVGVNSSLKVFRCGEWKSGTYLIRYFDNNNKLYTAYYEVPNTLPGKTQLQRNATNPLNLGPGDGSTFRFNFDASKSTFSTYNYDITGYTDFNLGNTLLLQNSILKPSVFNDYGIWDTTSCERQIVNDAIAIGKYKYFWYIDSVRNKLIYDFMAYMMNAVNETFNIYLQDLKYHFTLYYYDRAGNLCRTVPPGGVSHFNMANTAQMSSIDNDRNAVVTTNNATINQHLKVSKYKFNSVNLMTEQSTPDGGASKFWYDAVGRLIYSQNAQQFLSNRYSYTLYDEQSRICEVGEFTPTANELQNIYESHNKTQLQISQYLIGKNRYQVCATLYDEPGYDLLLETGMSSQENLRKRVSASRYFTMVPSGKRGDTLHTYDYAGYYSYDALGNVKTLTHDYKELFIGKQRFKRIDYQYDLYSGKVNMVSYNRGFADEFYQKYSYDQDNRIVRAETSKDGVYWDRDADYQYYPHGALARISMGDLNVQGIDYAYTLQGWLKAINGDVLDTLVDMGKDGKANTTYLKDVFALTLDYFQKDYTSISGEKVTVLSDPTKGLYNGNITRQNTSLKPFDALNKNYQYDPLNRIKTADYNVITPATSPNYSLTATDEFLERFDYDQDGNIMKLWRKGNKVSGVAKTMDSLQYFYNVNGTNNFNTAQNSVNSNRLNNVYDLKNHGTYSNDIPHHPTGALSMTAPVVDRFTYDALGNLVTDQMNGITSIKWNLYGKVSDINLPYDKQDHFTYDPTGNRISKWFTFKNKTKDTLVENREIYVRDASGNILAIFNNERKSLIDTINNLPIAQASPSWMPLLTYGLNTFSNFPTALISTYGGNPYYSNAMSNLAAKNSSITSNNINSTSFASFCSVNTGIFAKSIQYTYGFMHMVKQNNADLLKVAMQEMESRTLADNICNILGDDLTHIEQAMIELVSKFPHAVDFMNSTLDIETTGDVHTDVAIYLDRYSAEPGNFKDALIQLLNAPNDNLLTFKGDYIFELMENDVFYKTDESFYYMNTHPLFCDALYNFLISNEDYYSLIVEALDDDAQLACKNAMVLVCPPEELMAAKYAMDPYGIVQQVCNVYGTYNANKQALQSIPGLNANAFKQSLQSYNFNWMDIVYTLVDEHIHLAEHHFYGSSRLGIKRYLPNQYAYNWDINDSLNAGIDSSNLTAQQAWFNYELNDFINPLETEYTANADLDKAKWWSNRLLGLKNYELTNHLGNVQSTVLDKYTPRTVTNTDTSYSRWFTNISTANDYYPFGSLMPGRSTQDTVTQTLTATIPFNVSFTQRIDSVEANTSHFTWTHFAPPSVGSLTFQTIPTTAIKTNLGCPSSPVGFPLFYGVRLELTNLQVGKQYNFHLKYKGTFAETFKLQLITNLNPPNYPITGITDVSTAATDVLNLSFQAVATNQYLQFVYRHQCNIISIDSVMLTSDSTATGYVTTTLTNANDKDDYRFGFNGQEKDNEIRGTGNSLSYEARIYDSRLGRWLSLDPLMKKYPALSPYNFVDNSPINSKDADGRDIIVVCAPAGAYDPQGSHPTGHQALLVGNDKDGYHYYSFDGHKSKGNDGKTNGIYFKTMSDFANSEFNTYKDNYDDGKGVETSHRGSDGKIIQRYEQGYRIVTDKATDDKVNTKVTEYLSEAHYGCFWGYLPLGEVCTDVPKVALNTAGLQNGETSPVTRYNGRTGEPYESTETNWMPTTIQGSIEAKNKGTDADKEIKRTTTTGDQQPKVRDTNEIRNTGDLMREVHRWMSW